MLGKVSNCPKTQRLNAEPYVSNPRFYALNPRTEIMMANFCWAKEQAINMNDFQRSDAEFRCFAAVEEGLPLVKCRVFDMRTHPSNLAWDSASFTCGCPGLAVPCTKEDASQDLTWVQEIHAEGGLCHSAEEAVQPVTKMFLQLDQDACSANMLQSHTLTWSQRTYPAYPDLPGAGSGPQSVSGTYLCQHTTPYVLCPGEDLTTTDG